MYLGEDEVLLVSSDTHESPGVDALQRRVKRTPQRRQRLEAAERVLVDGLEPVHGGNVELTQA